MSKVHRKAEIRRRRHRREKLKKLRAKLGLATGGEERAAILGKIRAILGTLPPDLREARAPARAARGAGRR